MDEFLKDLEAHGARKPFRPCVYYNRDGDALEIHISPERYVAERVDPLFTVFVAAEDRDKVLGLAIKDVRKHFGPAGLRRLIFSAKPARVRLLIFGALFGREVTLVKENEPALPERLHEVLDKIGDTVVDLSGAREVVLQ